MVWNISFNESSFKELEKLSKQDQTKIISYLYNKIKLCDNPKDFGNPLGNVKAGLWRYRIEKFGIICQIFPKETIVVILKIEKRDKVYED